MTIETLLNKFDSHYPNSFTPQVKLDWANEIEGLVCAELNKNYALCRTTISSSAPIITLPDGVCYDDIESVTFNGKRIAKTDLRSHDIIGFSNTLSFGKEPSSDIEIVYIINHKPATFLEKDYQSIIFSADTVTFPDGCPFEKGDTVQITNCAENDNNLTVTVCSVSDNKATFNRTFSDYTGSAHLRRVLDKNLRASFPYDKIYLEYLIAKGDLASRDYDAYRNDMLIFNTSWMSYAKYLKQRSPQNLARRFKNYW